MWGKTEKKKDIYQRVMSHQTVSAFQILAQPNVAFPAQRVLSKFEGTRSNTRTGEANKREVKSPMWHGFGEGLLAGFPFYGRFWFTQYLAMELSIVRNRENDTKTRLRSWPWSKTVHQY